MSLHQIVADTLNSSATHRLPKEVKWLPPPVASYKLNVDGSSLGNLGRCGFGGIIRDQNGQWCSGFSGFCGFSTNINAELLAIYHGLKLAWQNGFTPLICESDSKSALAFIQNGVHSTHLLEPLVNSIQQFTSYP